MAAQPLKEGYASLKRLNPKMYRHFGRWQMSDGGPPGRQPPACR